MEYEMILDGRQSDRVLCIQRGVLRMWRNLGHASVCELTLASGRRADVVSIDAANRIFIAEIKSSAADFQNDRKWFEYVEWCDGFYFVIDDNTPEGLIPQSAGLVIADAFGAQILREPAAQPRLSPQRRKAMTLRFAQCAAWRLHRQEDPTAEIGF